jgi:hypothetical protein
MELSGMTGLANGEFSVNRTDLKPDTIRGSQYENQCSSEEQDLKLCEPIPTA